MAHCKHRIMDKCKKNGFPCTFSEDCFEPEKTVTRTNADRIRAMSDEELADFIGRIEIGDFGSQVYGKTFCDMCEGQYKCDDCRLFWLRQPAKEE